MSGGGKGKKSVTVGYRYYMGVHAALCHGPVDTVTDIIIGERLAWSGNQTASGTIYVNNPQLFGGDNREGGVQGYVDVMMGESWQARNSYLAMFQGGACPAYRGLASLVFRSFLWSSMNPYFKSPWVRLRRILQGWNGGSAWFSGYATIGGYDMNPAHIIYQCITDPGWGMGYNTSDIDEMSFQAAAITLYNEGFGLSLTWSQQSTINEFIQTILDHINGVLRLDLTTGKFVLKLIREDYSLGSLLSLDESNVLELRSFERASYGDFANEVVAEYTDRDESPRSIAVQDLASIQAQGSVVSTTKSYPGIRSATLAARVALRDLAVLSTPLAKLALTTNRVLWEKEVGDVVKFSWSSLGITNAPFRITSIDKGKLQDGRINVELVEDVFGLSTESYTVSPGSQWADTIAPPTVVEAARAIEVPFWEISQSVSLADQAYLQPQYGFGSVLATKGATNKPFSFSLAASATLGGTYSSVASGDFSPTGLLASNITKTQTTFNLTSFYDLDLALLDSSNGYAYVDNECMAVVSVSTTSGEVVVRRGVLDTVPATHLAGARMYFVAGATDQTERVSGETVYYKPLPTTGLGTLNASSATPIILTLNNRASRPYPPGQFKINTQYWPANINGLVQTSWVGRDRKQQTVNLIDYTQGNVGPEAGTTYTLRLYTSGGTLKRVYTSVTSPWTYPNADDVADGYMQTMKITLVSVVGGVESLYPHEHTFERYGLGFHLGDSLGGVVPS
jgi:hypothetical protein